MKILINTPSLKLLGGVSNHYLGLQKFWNENVKYNTIGKRGTVRHSGMLWLPFDIVKFVFKLISFKPDVVILNPSLGYSALKRDFVFLNIAIFLRFKVAIFIHGFDWEYVKVMNKYRISKQLNKASFIFVLAQSFKNEIRSWSINRPIFLTTTKVDNNLLDNYNPKTKMFYGNKNILFLTRIEESKGVYIAIRTYDLLKKDYPQIKFTLVGNGSELDKIKNSTSVKNDKNFIIRGRLEGEELSNAFKEGDLYIFPSYTEGMPTSVLEAMAFGLPIFTRNVGGLPDFFENGKMGYITDSLDPKDFANAMIPYLESDTLCKRVSMYNINFAKENFMASSVALKTENIIKSYLENDTKI